MSLSPDSTPEGYLPPFEVVKASAFHMAMEAIEKELGKPCYALQGKRVNTWIAEQLRVKGGGAPAERTMQLVVAKCKQPGRYLYRASPFCKAVAVHNPEPGPGDTWINGNSALVELTGPCWTERV